MLVIFNIFLDSAAGEKHQIEQSTLWYTSSSAERSNAVIVRSIER